MQDIVHAVLRYYGLDWLSMTTGLTGSFMISNRDKRGFILSGMSCICGLSVAILSGQTGFIAYNAILISIMCRGFLNWDKAQPQPVRARAIRGGSHRGDSRL